MGFKTLAYNQSLSLLTDFYQMTMSYAYWKSGTSGKEAVFHLFFRKNPFNGGFSISAGLEYAADFLENFYFDKTDLEYVASLKGNDGRPIFEEGFVDYLSRFKFECDIDALPEGTVVFPNEPIIRVIGPIVQCQILETILLNIINFQTLVATKAARIVLAARGDPVIEFGLRRAQGVDGALAASRAAYIGGCSATSNMMAGKLLGIPVRGTHAHSWVMSFDDEEQAFMEYAKAIPNNCIFLVDTYNSMEGVRKAVKAGLWLREHGYEMTGIRLDSGDLAYLSIEARKILDESGFKNSKILASNQLDESIITSLKDQGAKIDIWGVGTKLVTAYDEPALDGVYKLSAVRQKDLGPEWKFRIKISEQAVKITNPGILQVRRYETGGENIADCIYDAGTDLSSGCEIVDPQDQTRRKTIEKNTPFADLLEPVFRKGKRVYPKIDINEIREKTMTNLEKFHQGIKRFINPHRYPAGLEKSLFDKRTAMILSKRNDNTGGAL